MLAGADPALDRPMILFQNIVEILHGAMAAVFLQRSFGFELHDGRWVSCVLVGVDDPRRRMVHSAKRFGQKALGRRCIAFGREEEVDRRTARIHSPYKYTHLPLTRI
jgi:hypothetical protein